MAIRRKRGFGDWFDPSCEPGTPGCVPHAYCYVPFMATPDCLASFGEGVKEIAGGAGSAVGGVVGSAVSGVVSGVVGDGSGSGAGSFPWVPVVAIAGLAVFALVAFSGGSPRRYGR